MTPLTLSALPLRVISFNFQGPDPSRIQLLIHAHVGQSYTAPQSVAVAYMITDSTGRVVEESGRNGTDAPAAALACRRRCYSRPARRSPPGDYVLKLAAAEGNTVGSVEASDSRVADRCRCAQAERSDCRRAVPSGRDADQPVSRLHSALRRRPRLPRGVRTGGGNRNRAVRSRSRRAIACLGERDRGGAADQRSRALFSRMVPISALPPGRYQLRAIVDCGGATVKTLSRAFEIAGPPPCPRPPTRPGLTWSWERDGAVPASRIRGSRGTFQLADALRPEILEPFVARVPAGRESSFDEGVGHLRSGDYIAARPASSARFVPTWTSRPPCLSRRLLRGVRARRGSRQRVADRARRRQQSASDLFVAWKCPAADSQNFPALDRFSRTRAPLARRYPICAAAGGAQRHDGPGI